MRHSMQLGYWEPKYLKNDRVYVDITKDGLPWDYVSYSLFSNRERKYRSAKILESDEYYVKALVDGGNLIIVAKRHSKPVLSSRRILIIEPTNYPKELFVKQSQKTSEPQKKKFSMWCFAPLLVVVMVLLVICWE